MAGKSKDSSAVLVIVEVLIFAVAAIAQAQTFDNLVGCDSFMVRHYQHLQERYAARKHMATAADSGLTLLGRWAWGPCTAVDVKGDYAYIGNGPTFQILDISNDSFPRIVGEWLSPFFVNDIRVQDTLAYVCVGGGLTVLDVSHPASPEVIGAVDLRGGAWQVRFTDSLAFVLGFTGIVYAVDISDPRSMFVHGEISAGGLLPGTFTTYGRYVYLGEVLEFPQMHIINATNPDSLWEVRVRIYRPLSGAVLGRMLLVGKDDGIEIYDVHHPLSPQLLSSISLPDRATGIAVQDSIAYVTAGYSVYAVDISDPFQPILRGSATPTVPLTRGSFTPAVSGSHLVASYYSGVFIVDAAVRGSLTLTARAFFPTGEWAQKIALQDSLAFIASAGAGLWIVDISDPTRPKSVSNVQTGGYAYDVVVDGDYAYVLNWAAYSPNDQSRGLWIADISNPKRPRVMNHYMGITRFSGQGTPNAVAKCGSLLFISEVPTAGNDTILEIIDVSKPLEPHRVGVLLGRFRTYDLGIKDSTLYIAAIDSGLVVLDIRNPSNVVRIATVPQLDAMAVSVQDTIAFIASAYLYSININRPDSPFVMGSVFTHYGASNADVTASGNFVYWADISGGGVVDVSNRFDPKQVGTFRGQDVGRGIAAHGKLVFYADQTTGVWIWRNDFSTLVRSGKDDTYPSTHRLSQNYPNPFNSQTVIEFTLPWSEHAAVEVLNVLGQQVAVLSDGFLPSGVHRINFDARGLSSGVYFYRLRTESKMVIKPMLYVK